MKPFTQEELDKAKAAADKLLEDYEVVPVKMTREERMAHTARLFTNLFKRRN